MVTAGTVNRASSPAVRELRIGCGAAVSVGHYGRMPRRDFFNDPAAPRANSVVPSVVAAVRLAWVDPARLAELDIYPSMRLRIEHAMDRARTAPYIG